MIPIMKRPHSDTIAYLLPRKSAVLGRTVMGKIAGHFERWSETYGAPISAPKSVPIDNRATMRPERTVENWQELASPGVVHVAKRNLKSSMMSISEIWPVS
jgi:hypothetical protein